MKLQGINHLAIICSNYEISKKFYVDILGFTIMAENYRKERDSYKLDLQLNGVYCIELFSFPKTPPRPSYPEAAGLRHVAFNVADIEKEIRSLDRHSIKHEGIRIDPYTNQRFTFFSDPDGLPLELYEVKK